MKKTMRKTRKSNKNLLIALTLILSFLLGLFSAFAIMSFRDSGAQIEFPRARNNEQISTIWCDANSNIDHDQVQVIWYCGDEDGIVLI